MIFRKSYESANFRNLLKYLRKKVTKTYLKLTKKLRNAKIGFGN